MVLVAFVAGLTFVALTVAAGSEGTEADAGLASGMVTTAQQVGTGFRGCRSHLDPDRQRSLGGWGSTQWEPTGVRCRGGHARCRRAAGSAPRLSIQADLLADADAYNPPRRRRQSARGARRAPR
jgi:hypothetical protein